MEVIHSGDVLMWPVYNINVHHFMMLLDISYVVLVQHVFCFFFHQLCLPRGFETNFDVR